MKRKVPRNFGVVEEVSSGIMPGRSRRWRRDVQNMMLLCLGVALGVASEERDRARYLSSELFGECNVERNRLSMTGDVFF